MSSDSIPEISEINSRKFPTLNNNAIIIHPNPSNQHKQQSITNNISFNNLSSQNQLNLCSNLNVNISSGHLQHVQFNTSAIGNNNKYNNNMFVNYVTNNNNNNNHNVVYRQINNQYQYGLNALNNNGNQIINHNSMQTNHQFGNNSLNRSKSRTFQSVNNTQKVKNSLQNTNYTDKKIKRRFIVQSRINHIKSCVNQPNTTHSFQQNNHLQTVQSQYQYRYHYQQQQQQQQPQQQRQPQNNNNNNNIHIPLVSRYPKSITITNTDKYETVLKDYTFNNKNNDDDKLKYGEAQLLEITLQSAVTLSLSQRIKKGQSNHKIMNEYKSVTGRFLKFTKLSGLNNLDIVKVWKIKNDKLMDDYKWRKKSILRGLDNDASKLNEKCLYHGTNINVIPKIITQGFLRQFTTRHAFGAGCYFALNPAYSAHPRYSTPNSEGIQFIFVCSVICGEYCKGNARMKVPECKPNTNNVLYETTVNDIEKPTIFVTFNDSQAIPRYLIAFKNKDLKIIQK